MKIYLTLPYDPDGIEEAETTQPPYRDALGRDVLVYSGGYRTSLGWYKEGVTWHRKKKDAIAAARKFRARWIAEMAKKASEIALLPPI